MKEINIMITTTFGLEAVARRELEDLGYKNISVQNGRLDFKGKWEDIAILNLWLRTADRVFINMGEFKALEFEDIYKNVYKMPWDKILPEDANFIVNGKSVNSKLFSISDCQSITERAIIDKLQTKYTRTRFEKSGARYSIEVGLLKDIATISLDTSGEGLHKRGYRTHWGDAPIKETLAAAMVLLSYWNKDRQLVDPFCGSGTIPIEAAMIGRNIAPGLDRNFDSENWEIMDKSYWKSARREAFKKMDNDVNLNIIGSDIDPVAIKNARENAMNLGLEDDITFFTKDVLDLGLNKEYGVIITNPPYGERIGEKKEVENLYKSLGEKFSSLNTWSIYIITSNNKFESLYNKKASRRRKLYNGRIEVTYYQYYGPRPPIKDKKV